MKFFCYIFSAYILILACIPCSDLEHIHIVATENTLNTEQNTEPHDDDHCADYCSPFCYCACCGSSYQIFSLPNIVIEPKKCVVIEPKKTFFTADIWISEHLRTLFRPPQVG